MKPLEAAPGAYLYPALLDAPAQTRLLAAVRAVIAQAPLFAPVMPRTGVAFSVRMTNCGTLGWVSDREGYRYQPHHPETGRRWPPIPPEIADLWAQVLPEAPPPEACLINYYGSEAKMGLHQDRDESHLAAPVLSLSLGDDARFRIGGVTRGGPTKAFRLRSGDGFTFGGPSRLAFHGIDRLYPATSTLLAEGGRFNLTLRRVT